MKSACSPLHFFLQILVNQKSLRLVAGLLALPMMASLAHASPGTSFWGGGTAGWDTAHWATTSSGPFTSTYSSGFTVNIGSAGSAGTITLGSNITPGTLTFASGGYTLALAGKSLTDTSTLGLAGATVFDFGGTSSSVSFGTTSATWTGSLTINNFVTGTSSLKFGTSAVGLSSTDLALITFAGYSNGGAAQINSSGFVTPTGSAIPEPSTYAALAGLGALGLALYRRRRK